MPVFISGALEMKLGLMDLADPPVMSKRVVRPVFDIWAKKLTQSISEEFSGELHDLGRMSSQAKDNYDISDTSLEIGEDAHYGPFIRWGTNPWYTGTFGEMMSAIRRGERIKFPPRVFQWAQRKKGADKLGALYITWKIMTQGMGRVSASPIRRRYPSGKRGFDYPNFILNEKNKDDISDGIDLMKFFFVRLAYEYF